MKKSCLLFFVVMSCLSNLLCTGILNAGDASPARDGKCFRESLPGADVFFDENPFNMTLSESSPGGACEEKGWFRHRGRRGRTGEEGPRGHKGKEGPRGHTGEEGPRGQKGDDGPRGQKGDTGPIGPKGSTGPQGPTGPQGATGASSIDPPFIFTQILNVNKAGDDVAGDGSDEKPFLTIGHAMSVITDATSTKRYLISVGPGTYSENVSVKANVFIQGSAPVLTRVSSIDLNDPSWTVDDDNRSGLKTIQVLNSTSLDFVAVQSHQGKIYIFQCRLSDVTYTACNSINMCFLYNCELLSDVVQFGGQMFWYSSTTFGNVTIHDQTSLVNPIPGQLIDTMFGASGGGSLLPLTNSPFLPDVSVINDIPSPLSHTIQVDLAGFAVSGTLTITGDGVLGDTQVFATADGVPSLARTSITANGTLILSTFANGIGYEPSIPGNWVSPAPTRVQDALDRMANLLVVLNGGPIP